MMMPLTAMTTFLKTELVFAAFGVLRWRRVRHRHHARHA